MQCEESDKHVVCRDVDCSFFDAYSNNKKKKRKNETGTSACPHANTRTHTQKKRRSKYAQMCQKCKIKRGQELLMCSLFF